MHKARRFIEMRRRGFSIPLVGAWRPSLDAVMAAAPFAMQIAPLRFVFDIERTESGLHAKHVELMK